MMETSFRLLQSILFQSIANFHLQAPPLHLTGNIFHSQLYCIRVKSMVYIDWLKIIKLILIILMKYETCDGRVVGL